MPARNRLTLVTAGIPKQAAYLLATSRRMEWTPTDGASHARKAAALAARIVCWLQDEDAAPVA